MNFLIEKEDFLKSLKIVEKASTQKAIQPVLSNILIQTNENTVTFSATDLDITIVTSAFAQIKKQGTITLPTRTLVEIASKIPNKPVEFNLNEENQTVRITCGSSQFDVCGISSSEFPVNIDEIKKTEDYTKIQTAATPFVLGIKKTSFACANMEAKNVISGIYCSLSENMIEMVATDGNRLARVVEYADTKIKEVTSVIIPVKTLLEVQRIVLLNENKDIEINICKMAILFKIGNVFIFSRLNEGNYPPYKQLIPNSCEKKLIVNREEIISALERVAIMINEKMNNVKLRILDNKLYLSAKTPSEGMSEDVLDVKYTDEEMVIAFNYRYLLDCLKVMETKNVEVGLNGNLSVSVLKPENDENYLCLVMPMQIK